MTARATKIKFFSDVIPSSKRLEIVFSILDRPKLNLSDVIYLRFATQLLPVLAFYCITDTVQAVASGALRGCGHQRVGALCNLFSYYIVGLPVSFYCAFELNLGLYGLWIGNSIGSILQATLLLAAVWRTSWEHESELAKIRVSGGPLQQIDIVDGLPASALTSTPSIMGVDPTFSPHFERNRASRRGSYVRIN